MKADRFKLTEIGRFLSSNMDGMSPVQLAASRGLRFMFQHILRQELTTILVSGRRPYPLVT